MEHYKTNHNIIPNKEILFDNTEIIARASDRYRLSIKEALSISHNNPSINKQFENFGHTLKLHPHRKPTVISSNAVPPEIPPTATRDTQVSPNSSENVIYGNNNSNNIPVIRHIVSPNIRRQISNLVNNIRNENNNETPRRSNVRVLRTRSITIGTPT